MIGLKVGYNMALIRVQTLALITDKENTLAVYSLYMAEHGLPITTKMVQGFSWAIAILSGTQGHSKEETSPGKHWWHNFRVCHPDLHLRTANNLEHNQVGALNKEVADNYFVCLKTTMESSGLNGS